MSERRERERNSDPLSVHLLGDKRYQRALDNSLRARPGPMGGGRWTTEAGSAVEQE